ncbi:MAG TPA: hypothetical protein VNM91_07595, partial [Dehalococcoidia bacterium]|nr:hypothetical protein [Dehalococcoidia bacterium]
DVVAGRADRIPPRDRARLWTQVPAHVESRDRGALLWTALGAIAVDRGTARVAQLLATMPDVARSALRGNAALGTLLAHGILAPHDLPLRIIPAEPAALDGWRFA